MVLIQIHDEQGDLITEAEFTDDEWENLEAIAQEYNLSPEQLIRKALRNKE